MAITSDFGPDNSSSILDVPTIFINDLIFDSL